MKRCPSRGSYLERREKCELAFGHTGFHQKTLLELERHKAVFKWDGKGQFYIDEEHRLGR